MREGRNVRSLFAVAAVMIAALQSLGFRSPDSSPPPPQVLRQVRVAAPPKVLAPESAFDKEAQMSPRERMNRWNPLIAEAAKRFAVPVAWLRAVMQLESGGRTMLAEDQPMLSSAGAMGVMQLMPTTYQDMRLQYRLGANPYDPHDNILAGAAYLHWLYGKYGYPAMFAAYNDGPGNLEQRLLDGGLLPAETINYVGSITGKLSGGSGMRAKFTRPNGEPVLIDAAAVASVRAAFPGEYAPGVQTVIGVGRLQQGVRESVAQVTAAVRAHGGMVSAGGMHAGYTRLALARHSVR